MSTSRFTCPNCGVWLRVAIQPSRIEFVGPGQIGIEFQTQVVAHTCKEDKNASR